MGAKIQRIVSAFPDAIVTNEDLAAQLAGWDPERFEAKTGIASRRIVGPDETALDLAEQAFKKLAPEEIAKVDFILFCTETPDMQLPPNATLLHGRLGLNKNIGALDINLGCSGYVYGLALAKSLIAGKTARCVALITGDTYSKLISPDDHVLLPLFGDAATVTIVEEVKEEHIGEVVWGTDGSQAQALHAHNEIGKTDICKPSCLFMDGNKIFMFMMSVVPSLVQETLDKNSLTLEQVDKVVLHQANSYILDHLRTKMNIPTEKFFNNIKTVANTVSSTIPIALETCVATEEIQQGSTLLLVGFGVGLSWAGITIKL